MSDIMYGPVVRWDSCKLWVADTGWRQAAGKLGGPAPVRVRALLGRSAQLHRPKVCAIRYRTTRRARGFVVVCAADAGTVRAWGGRGVPSEEKIVLAKILQRFSLTPTSADPIPTLPGP